MWKCTYCNYKNNNTSYKCHGEGCHKPKKGWEERHSKIVEESEKMFKTHTEGQEIDI